MAILNYNNVQYDVVYIDPTLSESGDGTTPSTALITLPTLTDNTCYIIRRTSEEYLVDMPQTKYGNGLTHLLFLGMPREDSDFYPLIPTEVKEAWGNDSDTYANVRMNIASYTSTTANNIVLHMEALQSMVCENCYFFRDGNSGSANTYFNPMFWINTSADITYNSCKFGYAQYDLDDDDYLANNEDIATDTSKYPQCKCCSYFRANDLNSLILNNCIINQVRYLSTTNYEYRIHTPSFTVLHRCKNFIMTNCEYNMLNRYDHGIITDYKTPGLSIQGYYVNYTDIGYKDNAIIKDCVINEIFCNAVTTLTSLQTITLGTNNTQVENVQINFKGMKNFNVQNLNLTNSHQLFRINKSINTIKVNNITCDLTQQGQLSISHAPLLYIASNYSPVGNPNSYIKNINFKFPSEPERIIGYDLTPLHLSGTQYQWTTEDSWSHNSGTKFHTSGRTYLADNIVIEAYKGQGSILYLDYANARADHIYGNIYMNTSTLDVDTIRTFNSHNTCVTVNNASYLKCNEYIANMDKFDGTHQIAVGNEASVYVNKTNAMLFDEISDTSNGHIHSNSIHMCPNYMANGQLFARNAHTFAKSWNVVRTGSNSTASIKFSNNLTTVTDPNPLVLGLEPFSGIEVLPTYLGKHTLTCYVAAKNFTEEELKHCSENCWIDVIVPETTEDKIDITHTYSSKSRPWYADTSSWSGDAGLRIYKIEMPIDIKDLTKPVNVKINYKWVSTSGFVYVDPDIKLVPIA